MFNDINNIYTIFPFLKTTEPITIRGIKLYNSADLSAFDSSTQEKFLQILSMFYLHDDFRIKNMVVVHFNREQNKIKEQQFLDNLFEIRSLLAYFYSIQHDIFLHSYLSADHSNFYTFRQATVHASFYDNTHNIIPPQNYRHDINKGIAGYICKINNSNCFDVNYNSKIYPPYYNFYLNIYQNLSNDIQNAASNKFMNLVSKLFDSQLNIETIANRIFTSLKWYNKSNSFNISEEDRITFIAIGLESLLGLEPGKDVTKRFKETINVLVGQIPKLNNWIDQFYDVRSEIVHEGTATETMFQAYRDKNEMGKLRSLADYGKTVFSICFAALINGAEIANSFQFPKLLITNKERIVSIIKFLEIENKSLDEIVDDVHKVLLDIQEYKFAESDVPYNEILGCSKLFIKKIVESLSYKRDDYYDKFNQYLISENEKDKILVLGSLCNDLNHFLINSTSDKIKTVVKLYFEIIWHYIWELYYHYSGKL